MISIREILRLKFSVGLSRRDIAQSLNLSRTAVGECLIRSQRAGISWPLAPDLSDNQLATLLYPPAATAATRVPPDCEYMYKELKRKGVTLALLWEEYKQEHPDNGYQPTQFNNIYREWLAKADLVLRQEHRAGHKAFSDFSGGKLKITDPRTGEVRSAPLFVCALGASSFTYAEPFYTESAESWCMGQAHAFEYFGGVPEIVVPDNPRAVVTKACFYEPDLNADFLFLAQHFDVAVVPARVRKPKDKAIVEAAVGLATRWIIAKLRNHTFFSLSEAASAVRKLTDELNLRPFKRIAGTRRSAFESLDKPALKPLPVNTYSFTHIQYATVKKDYHVEVQNCFYSVPHALVQKRVEIRASSSTIQIFHNGSRVASHPTCQPPKKHSTIEEHMPPAHRAYKGWTPQKLSEWADTVGPNTAVFVRNLIASKKHPELAYRSSFGIMRLHKEFGREHMEKACQRALEINACTYKILRLILKNNMQFSPLEDAPLPQLEVVHNNIRGASYYTETTQENQNAHSSDPRKSQNT